MELLAVLLMKDWFLYLIRLQNGDLYTGVTTDVARRFAEHQGAGGKGAKYLRGRGPLQLVFQQQVGTRSRALRAEWAVKKLPKQTKEKLVQGGVALDSLILPPVE